MKTKVLSQVNCINRRSRFCAFFLAATLLPLFTNAVDLLSVPGAPFSPPVTGGGDSYVSLISADGRYVLFNSSANNLTHRTNGAPYLLSAPLKRNAFLRDRVQGTTTLISADSADAKTGEDDSTPTGISTNGQYVLFETASRITPARDSTNRLNTSEVYLRDVVNKTTTLVSVRMTSQFNRSAQESVMTPDARYVAFASSDANFVTNDSNNASDVFVRDLVSGQIQRASRGIAGSVSSISPEITPDGKFVAFVGTLISASPTQDVYVCDLGASNTFCVSANSHRFFSVTPWCYGQKISQDGKYVAYQASSLNLPDKAVIFRHNIQTGSDDVVTSNGVPGVLSQPLDLSPDGRFVAFIGKTNSSTGVFLWDGQSATATFVSADTNGLAPANMSCESPLVDPTGRYVTFRGYANGLVTNAVGNFQEHIYRRDLLNGITELVDGGVDGNATNRTLNSEFAMSADGRYVAFDSPDAELVVPDGNNASDVFVRDLAGETTELVSSTDAMLATATSGRRNYRRHVNVSADGHYAIFVADGTGLVSDYTNRFSNIFGRDLITQSNFVVSVDTNGLAGADGASIEPALSADGRYVVFTSFADNLVRNDTNHASDVFVRDLQTGIAVLASTNGAGPGSPNGASYSPTISADGRYVTYFSTAQNIVPTGGANGSPNLFVYDRPARTNYILATGGVWSAASTPDGHYVAYYGTVSGGNPANVYLWDSQLRQRIFTNSPIVGITVFSMAISTNGQWIAYISGFGSAQSLYIIDRLTRSNITVSAGTFGAWPQMKFSGDGRFLVYATTAANSQLDTNPKRDIYVFDVLTRSNSLVSRSFFTRNAPSGNSELPDISADGRYIVYQSTAEDIVPADTNHLKDVFLYDRQSGSTMLLSASIYGAGTADYVSQLPSFTADGQTVAFQSWASDITANDFNQGSDLFLLKLINPFDSTNPPPVLTGQLVLYTYPVSGGGAPYAAQLTWAAAPGFGYQVQYKTNLTDDAWLPVNGSVIIENGQGYVKDLAPDPDHRFYRIVAF